MIVPNVKVNYHDKIPMLVLGAENDHIITVKENKKTAAKYKAELKMMPNTAHNLMLDVENKLVANEIISWLN
jgi:alpha-beta hydrolase superfamily lysophospholipase